MQLHKAYSVLAINKKEAGLEDGVQIGALRGKSDCNRMDLKKWMKCESFCVSGQRYRLK